MPVMVLPPFFNFRESQAEPGSIFLGMCLQRLPDRSHILITKIFNLAWVCIYPTFIFPCINMIKFMLCKPIFKFNLINKIENLFYFRLYTHFFLKSSFSCIYCYFLRLWMAATGICPESATMVFPQSSLL